MLKNVRKSKVLLSIVAIALMFVLVGNVYSLATEGNSGAGTVTITATTDNTSASGNTSITANTNGNTANITSIVSASGNTANTTNDTTNNTSTYTNSNATSNTSGLPYTGSSTKTILLCVAFAISAIYAYKKVSDYNI